MHKYLFIVAFLFTFFTIHAQHTSYTFRKGLTVVANDSSFSMKFSTRFQTRYTGFYNYKTNNYTDQFLIRRFRLKFDGFAYSPKLIYKIELGFSNRDTGGTIIPQSNNTFGIILDAVLKYNFFHNWYIWFGQTKLPGNLERVVSSQKLQFVDRSYANGLFTLDRDIGVQLHYQGNKTRFIVSISQGEGRDITINNLGGYDYTIRGEWLPFGQFTNKGDYFMSDLKYEKTPKLLIGVSFDYNDRVSRQRGQLGNFMNEQRSLRTWFFDTHFKYKGLSSILSYVNKEAPQGAVIRYEDSYDAFYTGEAINFQIGYLFKNNYEISTRVTNVTPKKFKEVKRRDITELTAAVSKYIVGHNLKIQTDISKIKNYNKFDILRFRFQIELAF